MEQALLNRLSYGLFIVTAHADGRDNGCIINTAAQLSSDPLTLSISVNKANLTCDMIRDSGRFTLSVIAEDGEFALFERFGFHSGRDTDKFVDYPHVHRTKNGCMAVTKGTNAWISVDVQQCIDLGSHLLFIGTPTDGASLSEIPSATYAYYHEYIKPRPRAVGRTPEGKTIWRCMICGYEYVGEELPEDYICPLCKHPASDFEKIVVPDYENFEGTGDYTMNISRDIRYVGVNDHQVDLFEGHFDVPNGMAYNSYVILDEKIAVMDSVDGHFTQDWLANLNAVLDGRTPDYLIVQHMEPDHSSSILDFMQAYPEAVVVSNAKSFPMMQNFFGQDFADRRLAVGEGDTLSLGARTLQFITAPMVHWPEVIMTYDTTDKVLFSADAFGKFGALDVEEEWACEARRYYFGIVGKYGAQVQAVLKKAKALDIQTICPLHGPVLNADLPYYLGLYDTWSSYGVESEGVVIAYTSVYGNTRKAVELLAKALEENGCPKVVVNDLARVDMAEAVEDAFRYGKIVLATTTYNADIFPYMRQFIDALTERSFQNKTVGMMENGSWVPVAAKTMKGMLEKSRNLTFVEPVVRIVSGVKEENVAQIEALAKALV